LFEEISVKHITLAATGLALIALSSAAVTADMSVPSRVYTKAPVLVDPGYNWTGFYAGLNGGYSWGKADAVFLPGTAFATPVKQDVNGGLGGGQIGYNWQLDRTWVVGLEADTRAPANAAAQRQRPARPASPCPAAISTSSPPPPRPAHGVSRGLRPSGAVSDCWQPRTCCCTAPAASRWGR
jgi:opacity protein-like surface antigen